MQEQNKYLQRVIQYLSALTNQRAVLYIAIGAVSICLILIALGFIFPEGVPTDNQNITDNEMVNIFLPTTPNPTSGFLLFVPKDELIKLNMTVEEGIKMVISGGIVTPVDKNKGKKIKVKTRGAEIRLLKDVEQSISKLKNKNN